jgi:hypothetical protein
MNILNSTQLPHEDCKTPIFLLIIIIILIILAIIIIIFMVLKTPSPNTISISVQNIQIYLQEHETHSFSYEIYSELTNPEELYKYFNQSISKDTFNQKHDEQMEMIKNYLNEYKIENDPIIQLISIIQCNMNKKFKSIILHINKSSKNDIDKYTLILANILILLENVCYNQNIPFIESC